MTELPSLGQIADYHLVLNLNPLGFGFSLWTNAGSANGVDHY